jgi:hypothetical protein
MVTAIILTVLCFVYFKDFAFGFKGPANAYKSRRWVSTWNFYDKPDDIVYENGEVVDDDDEDEGDD